MTYRRFFSKDVEYRGYVDHCYKGIILNFFFLFKIKDCLTSQVVFLDSQGSFVSGLCLCIQMSICFAL